MPAYIVSVVQFTNMTAQLKEYAQKSAALAKRQGGRYIVRSKAVEIIEGTGMEGRSVVILEFPTMEQLKAFVKGEEYQQTVRPLRAGTGIYDIGIFESPPPAMQ
ncbi:MAG: DUF1330 domain-containing protein [Gammaproteobacteria bacterium]|nr:DUF1330 domain-containing protein [Gammaproteobacteria bacterium]